MVVSFQDQEPVLPEELPKGYPEDAPPLTGQLLREGISLPPLRFETRNAEPGQFGKRRIAKEDEEC